MRRAPKAASHTGLKFAYLRQWPWGSVFHLISPPTPCELQNPAWQDWNNSECTAYPQEVWISYQAALICHGHVSVLKDRTVLLLPFLHRREAPYCRNRKKLQYLDEPFSTSRVHSLRLFQSGVPYSHLQQVMVEEYLEGLLSHSAECCTPERDSPASQLCRTYLQALEPHILYTKSLRNHGPSHTSAPALASKQWMRKRGCRCNISPPPSNQWHYDTCNNILHVHQKPLSFTVLNLRILSTSYSFHTVEQPEARSHLIQEAEAGHLGHQQHLVHRAGWSEWRKTVCKARYSELSKSMFMWEGIV